MNNKLHIQKSIMALAVFAIFAISANASNSTPAQQEPSVLSLYEDITTEETKEQYMKMEQQVQEFQKKQEEKEHGWTLAYVLCAIGALTPALIVFISFIRSGKPVPSFNEAARATAICLGGAALLFALNIGCLHVYADGSDTLKKLMILALASILILAVWIYTKGLSNKN